MGDGGRFRRRGLWGFGRGRAVEASAWVKRLNRGFVGSISKGVKETL